MTIKDYAITILSIIIVVLIFFTFFYKDKYKNIDNTIVIMNDTIEKYKNKYKEEYTAKNTYVLKAEQLEKYNKELYNEYKTLKDNPLVITKTETVFKVDTIIAKNENIFKDSTGINWVWNVQDSTFYKISGSSYVNYKNDEVKTIIEQIAIQSGITIDIIEEGDQLKAIAKTDNPYLTFNNINSAVIDPLECNNIKKKIKPKHWGFGPCISGGIIVGYDFNTKKCAIGAGGLIGFSIHYDLIQW